VRGQNPGVPDGGDHQPTQFAQTVQSRNSRAVSQKNRPHLRHRTSRRPFAATRITSSITLILSRVDPDLHPHIPRRVTQQRDQRL
jgi:hypothetical protein